MNIKNKDLTFKYECESILCLRRNWKKTKVTIIMDASLIWVIDGDYTEDEYLCHYPRESMYWNKILHSCNARYPMLLGFELFGNRTNPSGSKFFISGFEIIEFLKRFFEFYGVRSINDILGFDFFKDYILCYYLTLYFVTHEFFHSTTMSIDICESIVEPTQTIPTKSIIVDTKERRFKLFIDNENKIITAKLCQATYDKKRLEVDVKPITIREDSDLYYFL